MLPKKSLKTIELDQGFPDPAAQQDLPKELFLIKNPWRIPHAQWNSNSSRHSHAASPKPARSVWEALEQITLAFLADCDKVGKNLRQKNSCSKQKKRMSTTKWVGSNKEKNIGKSGVGPGPEVSLEI